ncbi:MAG: hypothetical protein US52_C0006G0004 [candidate division WS6 bacterium GW2011_GWA2_37_6]|uniref:Uncharacterized protein n=1 Tax=candidate division WS6 bacterium GW2011_GWA2_37_6 TaxID=1619087 RepID=A0A0G0JHD6_9BACT|nr:MAG: hypothetical protein US52_C0006G0004 [candidate division WS6 bacterium GW2011_GWA2_37_6]
MYRQTDQSLIKYEIESTKNNNIISVLSDSNVIITNTFELYDSSEDYDSYFDISNIFDEV